MTNRLINATIHLRLREVDGGAIGGTLGGVSSIRCSGGAEVNRASSSFGVRVGSSSEVGVSISGVTSADPASRSNDPDVFFGSVVFILFPPPHLSVIPTRGS